MRLRTKSLFPALMTCIILLSVMMVCLFTMLLEKPTAVSPPWQGYLSFAHRGYGMHPSISSSVTCQRGGIRSMYKGSDATFLNRICHFRDICWDRMKQEFVFFQDPAHPRSFVPSFNGTFDVERMIANNLPFVQLRKMKFNASLFLLPLRFQKRSVPLNDAVYHPSPVHVIYRDFWPENFGHALNDDIIPIYVLMKKFDVLTRDVQIMTLGDCCELTGRVHGQDYERGRRFIMEYSKLLSDLPLVEMNKNSAFSGQMTSPRYICLRSLLAGHGMLGLESSERVDRSWNTRHVYEETSSFVDYALEQAIKMYPKVRDPILNPPPKHRITLLKKDGRRRVLNLAELAEEAQRLFPGASVEIVDPSTLSLEETIAIAQQTTVLFTPCGGISFFGMFLRKHASNIVAGYWDLEYNRSHNMESFFWEYFPRIHTTYYDVRLEDVVVMAPGDPDRRNYDDYRNFGSFFVDKKTFGDLIQSAHRAASRILQQPKL